MAYHSEDDTYSCDICGFRNKWEAYDKIRGELLSCEKCGRIFCSSCFTDEYGAKEYMCMMQGSNHILCPYCWEEERKVDEKC